MHRAIAAENSATQTFKIY